MTDLFMAASGWSSDALAEVVPPACRHAVDGPPSVTIDGGGGLIQFDDWRPRRPTSHLVPALSVLTDQPYSARFELAVASGDTWSPWVAAATLGSQIFAPLPPNAPGLASDIDVFVTPAPVHRVRLRLRLRAASLADLLAQPWLVSLSAHGPDGENAAAAATTATAKLPVPPLSQLTVDPRIARRICSPTSVGMVLEYLGRPVDLETLAAEMFHPALDRYGVWPEAIRAAGRRGVGGYLLRFPDWDAAAWCLEHGLAVIASVRYAEGELTGAVLPATDGHLLVLTGQDGADVLVNDPIAPTATEVRRRYRLDELRRVWLERAGIGYVLFDAAGRTTVSGLGSGRSSGTVSSADRRKLSQ